jgi:signal transduction histidine kinase
MKGVPRFILTSLLSLLQIVCNGQYSADKLNYDYQKNLDSLKNKSASACDSFFTTYRNSSNLSPCLLTTVSHDHAALIMEKGESIGALRIAEETALMSSQCSDTLQHVKIHLLLGKIYSMLGKRDKALENFLLARRRAEGIAPPVLIFEILDLAALLQYHSRNYIESINLHQEAHALYRKYKEEFNTKELQTSVMKSYNTLGMCYRKSEKYDEAISNFVISRAMAREIGDEFWIGNTNGNIGFVHANLGLYDSARYYILLDAALSKKYDQRESLVHDYFNLADIYEKEGKIKEAMFYYDSAERILIRYAIKDYPLYFKKLSDLKYARGEYKRAIHYYSLFHQQTDSLQKLETSNTLLRIQKNYEAEKTLADMELIRKDNTIKSKELGNQKILLFGSISMGVLLLITLYQSFKRYRQKKELAKLLQHQVEERTKELTETNAELDMFLYRASHDFRAPLSRLMGLQQIAKLSVKDPEAIHLLSKVEEVATVMDKMLGKIVGISQINQKELKIVNVNLRDLCTNIITPFQLLDNQTKIHNLIDEHLTVQTNPEFLRITIENLVENAIKSGMHGTELTVTLKAATLSNDLVSITISDNGKGIDEKYQDKIFLPFFRADDEHQHGNGLGLYLVKKSIQKLGGDIKLYSKPGEGSSFTLIFPKSVEGDPWSSASSQKKKQRPYHKISFHPVIQSLKNGISSITADH